MTSAYVARHSAELPVNSIAFMVEAAEYDLTAAKVHAAFAKLAEQDPHGEWPAGAPFTHDGVSITWVEAPNDWRSVLVTE